MQPESCRRLTPSQADPKISARQSRSFNKQILYDTFHIWDANSQKNAIIYVMCGFSMYHVDSMAQIHNSKNTA